MRRKIGDYWIILPLCLVVAVTGGCLSPPVTGKYCPGKYPPYTRTSSAEGYYSFCNYRASEAVLKEAEGEPRAIFVVPIWLFQFPMLVAFDIAFLPITLAVDYAGGNFDVPSSKNVEPEGSVTDCYSLRDEALC